MSDTVTNLSILAVDPTPPPSVPAIPSDVSKLIHQGPDTSGLAGVWPVLEFIFGAVLAIVAGLAVLYFAFGLFSLLRAKGREAAKEARNQILTSVGVFVLAAGGAGYLLSLSLNIVQTIFSKMTA